MSMALLVALAEGVLEGVLEVILEEVAVVMEGVVTFAVVVGEARGAVACPAISDKMAEENIPVILARLFT